VYSLLVLLHLLLFLLFGKWRKTKVEESRENIFCRNRRHRTQASKGPNKIILLPDDLMFVMPKGSIFTSKVCQNIFLIF
jgi:hypothetical protein